MNIDRSSAISTNIKSYIDDIVDHKLYAAIEDLDDMKIFMEFHVYAVWDFMSLLKSLQKNLTCVSVPWFPVGNADTRYLINEIVTGEEADVDLNGIRKSHFEMYLDAMEQCGANTDSIKIFIKSLQQQGDLQQAFKDASTPEAAKEFVSFTFDIINTNKTYLQSAIFTYGREDLIPGMFVSILNDIDKNFPNNINIFKYYIERHIEVDGDHHSNLAIQMTKNLCGNNEQKWSEAEDSIKTALIKRIGLWDGAYNEIIHAKKLQH